jgi:hypothetical protein
LFETNTSAYTLGSGDEGRLIEMNVATANVVTIPNDSTYNFPIGTQILICQIGAGATSVAPAAGVTLNSEDDRRILAQRWSLVSLIKRANNTWLLTGNLAV